MTIFACPECGREGPEDSRCGRCDRELVPPRPSDEVGLRHVDEARAALRRARAK